MPILSASVAGRHVLASGSLGFDAGQEVCLEGAFPFTIRSIFTGSDSKQRAEIENGRIVVTVENYTSPLGQCFQFDLNRGGVQLHVKLCFKFIGQAPAGIYALSYTILG